MSAVSEEDRCYDTLLSLVKEAGSLVRECFNRTGPVFTSTKASDIDLVTETDRAVEQLIIAGLRREFPHHKFIGEESSAEHGQKNTLTNDPTWMIDPIDGTTNFVHKFPFVCISVALYVDRRPSIGVVFNPVLNELFSARAGQGAFKNGFPIRCSGNTDLKKAVVVLTLGLHNLSTRADSLDIYLENTRKIARHGIRGGRSLGSAALNMCYIDFMVWTHYTFHVPLRPIHSSDVPAVFKFLETDVCLNKNVELKNLKCKNSSAAGSCDGFAEYGIHCWDIAAAALIIQEAGGCILDPAGTPFDVMSRRVLCASTKEVAVALSSLLQHVELPRDD